MNLSQFKTSMRLRAQRNVTDHLRQVSVQLVFMKNMMDLDPGLSDVQLTDVSRRWTEVKSCRQTGCRSGFSFCFSCWAFNWPLRSRFLDWKAQDNNPFSWCYFVFCMFNVWIFCSFWHKVLNLSVLCFSPLTVLKLLAGRQLDFGLMHFHFHCGPDLVGGAWCVISGVSEVSPAVSRLGWMIDLSLD